MSDPIEEALNARESSAALDTEQELIYQTHYKSVISEVKNFATKRNIQDITPDKPFITSS